MLGVPLAWLLARVEFPGRRLVRALVTVPLVLPPVVGGVALLLVFGRRGLVGAVAGRHVRHHAAVHHRRRRASPRRSWRCRSWSSRVEGALRGADPRYEEAAATLGAGRWTTFRRVTLPLVAPGVAAGAVLCWARALGEFGATITFAGNFPGRTQTMPLAVYLALETDLDAAIVLSLVLLAVSVAVLAGLRDRWMTSAMTATRLLRRPARRRPRRASASTSTLRVAPGEVVALLGPNGAGKTTALRALAGLLPLDRRARSRSTATTWTTRRPARSSRRSAARSAWSSRTTCCSRT